MTTIVPMWNWRQACAAARLWLCCLSLIPALCCATLLPELIRGTEVESESSPEDAELIEAIELAGTRSRSSQQRRPICVCAAPSGFLVAAQSPLPRYAAARHIGHRLSNGLLAPRLC